MAGTHLAITLPFHEAFSDRAWKYITPKKVVGHDTAEVETQLRLNLTHRERMSEASPKVAKAHE